MTPPRLRMFAGPNGSGKSTLKAVLPAALLGVYLNPDELEQAIRQEGYLALSDYGVTAAAAEALAWFAAAPLLKQTGQDAAVRRLSFAAGRLSFAGVKVDSYLASVAVEFLRRQLIEQRVSFTLETVMSHPGKVDLLAQAQQAGYRTYLYYVATDDPEINISRVRNRVKLGGHSVPEDRIVTRYHRSLELLLPAIRHTNRAYIFDNSTEAQARTWLAEITDGRELEMRADRMPAWFKRAVWDKLKPLTAGEEIPGGLRPSGPPV